MHSTIFATGFEQSIQTVHRDLKRCCECLSRVLQEKNNKNNKLINNNVLLLTVI